MRHLLFLAVLLLTACESDKAKYERLSREVWTAEIAISAESARIQMGEPACPSLASLPTNQYMAACDSLRTEHQTRLALARRALNKFMESK